VRPPVPFQTRKEAFTDKGKNVLAARHLVSQWFNLWSFRNGWGFVAWLCTCLFSTFHQKIAVRSGSAECVRVSFECPDTGPNIGSHCDPINTFEWHALVSFFGLKVLVGLGPLGLLLLGFLLEMVEFGMLLLVLRLVVRLVVRVLRFGSILLLPIVFSTTVEEDLARTSVVGRIGTVLLTIEFGSLSLELW
jgi:hypothetical protein